MRNKLISTILSAVLPLAVFASANDFPGDYLVSFSSPGPDRYADGTIVPDGECYALVWSPAGKTFSGFNADGTAASDADRVVLAGPLALDGRCRDSIFQVPEYTHAALEGGNWAVCLVDTRRVNGVPAGVKDGKPVRVNRWGLVNGGVSIKPASASARPPAGGTRLLASAAPVTTRGAGVRAASGNRSDASSYRLARAFHTFGKLEQFHFRAFKVAFGLNATADCARQVILLLRVFRIIKHLRAA